VRQLPCRRSDRRQPASWCSTISEDGERYNITELTERMAEQLISIHPDMPDFSFSEQQAKAIRGYLYSIQR
jgi:hypothetical protein